MTQEEFSERIKENWTGRLRWLYEDKFEFMDGMIDIEPSRPALAGATGTWILNISLSSPIYSRGSVEVQLNNSLGANWVFDILQIEHPQNRGYVKVRSRRQKNVELELELRRQNLIVISIVKGFLKPGTKLSVIFGETSRGSPGATLKTYAQEVNFCVRIKESKDSPYKLVNQVPVLKVLPRGPFCKKIVFPSIVKDKQPTGKLISFDRFGNPIGEPSLMKGNVSKDVVPNRIFVKERGLCWESNPVICKTSNETNLYWGDIHGHTYLGDGLEDPSFFYEYARRVECLDFCAITEHDTWLDERKWEYIRKVNQRFYEPGEFVTLLGFEWSSAQFWDSDKHIYGHKCIYYPHENGNFYSHLDKRFETPEKLWKALKQRESITIAHHPAYAEAKDSVWGTDWNYHNDKMEPLVEIYSKHGLNEVLGNTWPLFSQDPERFVQSALCRGHKLGFTGGTDTHISRPASNMLEFRRGIRYPKGGMTAVYANKLTREAIYDALKNRQCYATTGERIIIEHSINGHPMGSIITLSEEEPINIVFTVIGTDRLAKVELIRNNGVIVTKSTDEDYIHVEHVDKPQHNRDYFYYLRVTQVDMEMAWSTPIWIEFK